jgi:hypothetical protein
MCPLLARFSSRRGVTWLLASFFFLMLLMMMGLPATLQAQENYFVTYSHEMEEPGNLEIEITNVTGSPKGGNPFVASALELEYGLKTWWTAELYLDGQTTAGESTVFTGFRIENRFRPLLTEHRINPALYFEFEDINGADKTLLEVVGHDTIANFQSRNDRSENEREAELKLILSSNFKGWNVSENFIAEKNLAGEPWEFGYALGASRALALALSAKPCRFCRENFALGAEMYGGLGEVGSFGLSDTSHYLGPAITWNIPRGPTFRLSPTFGLNGNSMGFLFRFKLSYEIDQLISRLRSQP